MLKAELLQADLQQNETFPVFRNKENNLTKLATTKYNFANENSIKFILNN